MRTLVMLAIGLVLVAGSGCRRGDLREARKLVSQAAKAVRLVDLRVADRYGLHAAECLEASDTRQEYDVCLTPWDKAVSLVRDLRLQVHEVENQLVVWEVTEDARPFKAAACRLYETATTLRALLAEQGEDLTIEIGGFRC